MGYALQQKDAPSAPVQTPVDETPQKASPPPQDVVPEENKQAADKDKAKDDPAKVEAEKKRAAEVTATWQGLLGKWLGGKLAPLVLDNVSVDALNGYVDDALKAAGPALGDALKGAAKPDEKQAKALKDFSDALAGVMTGQVDKWVSSPGGQKVLKAISGFVQDNPGWVMGIVGSAVIGGAIAAFFANPDLPKLEVPLNLGKGWELKAGLDLGHLKTLGFQGASLVVAQKNAQITAKAEVKKDEEKNEAGDVTKTTTTGKVEVAHGPKDKEDLVLAVTGTVSNSKDGLVAHTAGGSLKFVDTKSGLTMSLTGDGKWDSKGNDDRGGTFTMATGKDAAVNGKVSFNAKQVTLVDEKGNITKVSSQELSLAVGGKGASFDGSVKHETDKNGDDKTTVGVKGEAQLGAGALFNGNANVEIGETDVKVKLNGQLKTTLGGKEVTFDGTYETDGKVIGKIKVGEGEEYKEFEGIKSGDVVTFKTTDVFKGGSLTRETDSKGGQQATATGQVAPGQTVTATAGTKGNQVGYEGKNLGGSGVGVKATAGDQSVGAGVSYDKGWLKAHLDATMKQGETTLGLGASVTTEGGVTASGDLKVVDSQIKELALKLGYQDPDHFRSFLVGYKLDYMKEHPGVPHHQVDAKLEYALGNWSTRIQGGADLMGNQVSKLNLDVMGGYKLNDKWAVIGGAQVNSLRNTDNNAYKTGVKPYLGMQYGGIGVAGFYDTGSKAAGVMLTIPLGFK